MTTPSQPTPAAAEGEAERRYPDDSVSGIATRFINQEKQAAFVAGASWQREQSAPSACYECGSALVGPLCPKCSGDALVPSEREKCLRVLDDAAEFIRDRDEGDQGSETGWKSDEYLDQWIRLRHLAARLRSPAPSEEAKCPTCGGNGDIGPAKTPEGDWLDQPCPTCNGGNPTPPAMPPAAAPGWKTVPTKLTPEMRAEMSGWLPLHGGGLDAAYEAALAAAPAAPGDSVAVPREWLKAVRKQLLRLPIGERDFAAEADRLLNEGREP